jgi:hypothetical protein
LKSGLSSITGQRGIISDFENQILNGKIKIGMDEATDFMEKNIPIPIDLGVIVEASGLAVIGSVNESGLIACRMTPIKFPTVSRYKESGVDEHLHQRAEGIKKLEPHILALSKDHGRTLDVLKFEKYVQSFDEHGDRLMNFNYTKEVMVAQHKLDNRKRSYWATIPNKILSLVDAVLEYYLEKFQEERKKRASKIGEISDNIEKEKAIEENKTWEKKQVQRLLSPPVLLIGRPTFKSTMKGKRASNPVAIIEYLKRFFPVILIDEFNTSKLCPCCQGFLEKKRGVKGTRVWECTKGCKSPKQPTKNLTVNKDVSAAVNIFTIFITLLMCGARPIAFCPKTKSDDSHKPKSNEKMPDFNTFFRNELQKLRNENPKMPLVQLHRTARNNWNNSPFNPKNKK